MEQEPNLQSENSLVHSNWKIQITTVTPLSKYLAMVLFIALPFLGFWVGYETSTKEIPYIDYYQDESKQNINILDDTNEISAIPKQTETTKFYFVSTDDTEIATNIYSNKDGLYHFSYPKMTMIQIKDEGLYGPHLLITNPVINLPDNHKSKNLSAVEIYPNLSSEYFSRMISASSTPVQLTQDYFAHDEYFTFPYASEFLGPIETANGLHGAMLLYNEYEPLSLAVFPNIDGSFFVLVLHYAPHWVDSFPAEYGVDFETIHEILIASLEIKQ